MNIKYLISIGLFVFLIALSAVSASDSIDVTTGDTFYFYSTDSLAANDGYYAAVVVDGTPYYLNYDNYDKLCEYSTSFAEGLIRQFRKRGKRNRRFPCLAPFDRGGRALLVMRREQPVQREHAERAKQ